MANLHVFRDGAHDGPTNMARDEHLLYSNAFRPASLRIYGWSPPTISLGYFQSIAEVGKLPEDVRSLAVVRRTTGGGAILHDREITYCLVVDDSIPVARRAPAELYRVVHECWRKVLAADGTRSELAPDEFPLPSPRSGPFFCFEKPGRTDLIIGAEKLLGSAQRRIPGRVLQHGSLLLEQRYASHPGVNLGIEGDAATWIEQAVHEIAKALSLEARTADWNPESLSDVAERRKKYAGPEWNEMR